MTADEARTTFADLSPQRKLQVVSLLAHNLTVAARGWYPGESDEGKAARKLRVFNELLHTISAKLTALASGDPQRFPDDGFLDVLFEKAQQDRCEGELLQAIRIRVAHGGSEHVEPAAFPDSVRHPVTVTGCGLSYCSPETRRRATAYCRSQTSFVRYIHCIAPSPQQPCNEQ
jgi:hypothetical protein